MNLTLVSEDKKLSDDLSGEGGLLGREMRKDLLQAVVRWQLACRRAGTVATKTKGLVRGGGKKPFKQKGTGNARQGSSRSPLMPGGGTAFGPQPRDYSYTLPRKVKQAGLATALSYLNAEKRLWVVDGFKSDGKSKQLALSLDKAGVAKAILCDDGKDVKVNRAARNLRKYKHLPVGGLNVFDLLKYDGCVITKEALKQLSERLEGADGK